MWASIFSRKKPAVAAPVEVRTIEVTATTTTPTSTSTSTSTSTPTPKSALMPAATTTTPPSKDKEPTATPPLRIKSEPTSRATTPTASSTSARQKRPRTSDTHSAPSSHLRKRTRHSLAPGTIRSPLIRAAPQTLVKTEPSRTPPNSNSSKQQLPTPAGSIAESITTLTLLSPQPKAKPRRSRLSLPVEDDTGSAVSTVTEEDDEELLREGFSLDEVTLFQRIRKRGMEALMPAHWQVDFATMPDNLFRGPGDAAVIEGLAAEGTFAATAAFQAIVNLGAGVRGKLETRREVEGRILGVLRRYVTWAVEDAALVGKHIQPMIAISSSQERGAEHCEQRMDKKLHDLAAEFRTEEARLRAAGHEIPSNSPSTVYGMAVAGCVVALITLDARNRKAPTRTLLVVDFSDVTLDFWNAVGVALMVIAARDDESIRLDWYKEVGETRPERRDGAMAWMGRVKIRKVSDEEDEDK